MTRIALPLLALALAACSGSEEPTSGSTSGTADPTTGASAAPSEPGAELAVPISRYTSLKDCKLVELKVDEDWSVSRCPGLGGYTLVLNYGDARESLTLLKNGKTHAELRLWLRGGGGFNAIGQTVEWRGAGAGAGFVPHFLILRNIVYRNPEQPERKAELLEVFDLAQKCSVASIEPQPGQNEAARAIADGLPRTCPKQES